MLCFNRILNKIFSVQTLRRREHYIMFGNITALAPVEARRVQWIKHDLISRVGPIKMYLTVTYIEAYKLIVGNTMISKT